MEEGTKQALHIRDALSTASANEGTINELLREHNRVTRPF